MRGGAGARLLGASAVAFVGRSLLTPAILQLTFFLALLPGAVLGAVLGVYAGVSGDVVMHGGPGAWFAADLYGRARPLLRHATGLLMGPLGLLAGLLTGPVWFGFLGLVLVRDRLLGRPRLQSLLRRARF